MNGDGYDDVAVGARNYTHGEDGEGVIFVFAGSPSGAGAAPIWAGEANQIDAWLGPCAAAADVNGDGYDDLVAGAPKYDGGQVDVGRAFLWLGSAAGLTRAPAWTAEADVAGAGFGEAVAGAGDVNGDGYDDVIVGARLHLGGGMVFLYLGSPAGLGRTPAWTAQPNPGSLWFGASVAGAGDLNGDGFGDVVVGDAVYTDGELDEGAAFVYLGSAAGLRPGPRILQVDQPGASFGFSVGPAGDVDDNGYDDLAVGAPNFDDPQAREGRAYVYRGR